MPDLPPPARISSSNLNVGWNMMYAPLLQIWKRKYSFRRILWRCRLLYSAIFGAPGLPVRAWCLKYTILSAPLHTHFGSYLLGWAMHTLFWHEYMCHSLFGPCACAHSTAAPMREGMRKYCGCACVHVSLCAGQCSLCVMCLLLCIDDK